MTDLDKKIANTRNMLAVVAVLTACIGYGVLYYHAGWQVMVGVLLIHLSATLARMREELATNGRLVRLANIINKSAKLLGMALAATSPPRTTEHTSGDDHAGDASVERVER